MEPELAASLPPLPRVSANMSSSARPEALSQLYHRLAVLGGIYWGAFDEPDRDRARALRDWAWSEAVHSLRTCAAAKPSISHLGTMEVRGEWHWSDIDRLFLEAGLKSLPPEPPLTDQLLAVIRRAERRGLSAKEIRRALRDATKNWLSRSIRAQPPTPCSGP